VLSAIGELVRRHDSDRFFTALLAPPDRREALLVLYAFNHELARAREVTSQPTLALIRLQWWREVVGGAARRHDVAEALGACLRNGALDPEDLLSIIEAREIEAEPAIADLSAWKTYLAGCAGGVAVAAGRALGADATERYRLRMLGAAYGAAGVLRSVPVLARQGRCLLPQDWLATQGLTTDAVIADPSAPKLAWLAEDAKKWLDEAARPRLRRDLIAAALPATLARRDLARMDKPLRPRGLGDRLAVVIASISGYV
jgi:phytoene synthase